MIENSETKTCKCGRSPSGQCIGWHLLTEEEYKREAEFLTYRQQATAQFFEYGSCTGGQETQ